jgi:hypothetical protein
MAGRVTKKTPQQQLKFYKALDKSLAKLLKDAKRTGKKIQAMLAREEATAKRLKRSRKRR